MIGSEGTATNMTRSHGPCRRGERLRMGHPHGYRKTTTLVAGLRMTGMVAPMVLDGPANGDWFEAYAGQVLVPDLRRGAAVIMDNLSSHKRVSVREAINAVSARLLFLPPGKPRLQPDREGVAHLKAMLRKAGARTVSGSGPSSASWSTCSSRRDAPTTSAPVAMIQTERKPL
jgi:transposase